MKKIILALSIAAIASTPVLAYEPEPGYKVLEQFKKEFPTAEDARWVNEADFERVSFVLSGRRVIAFFNQEGELEGTIRDIFYDQLPLTVMSAVQKRFKKPVVLHIREISNAEGTHYKIRLDVGSKKYTARVNSSGNISSVEKVK